MLLHTSKVKKLVLGDDFRFGHDRTAVQGLTKASLFGACHVDTRPAVDGVA